MKKGAIQMDFDYYAKPQMITAVIRGGGITKRFIAYHGYVVDLATGNGMNLDDFEFQYGAWDLKEIPWTKD